MTVIVRDVTVADTLRISEIEDSVFVDPWSANTFRSLPGDPRVMFVCAAESGVGLDASDRVVGYVVAIFAADEGEIANLAVAVEAQGRGVGQVLLDAVIADAGRRGTATLYLEVRESNSAARRLYRSRKFEEVGRRRGYYQRPTEDALLLRLSLGSQLK